MKRSKRKIKTVGRSVKAPDPIHDAAILLKTINRLRNYALIPRGVYRFKTFEESELWMIKEMAATHARQS